MIKDTLKNCTQYACLNKGFKKAFSFIQEFEKKSLSTGTYELDGENVFAIISDENETSPYIGGQYETHEKYIDVQYVTEGAEVIHYVDIDKLTIEVPYIEDSDYALYFDTTEYSTLHLEKGEFAIFFPQDGHMPCLRSNKSKISKKIIVKVKL